MTFAAAAKVKNGISTKMVSMVEESQSQIARKKWDLAESQIIDSAARMWTIFTRTLAYTQLLTTVKRSGNIPANKQTRREKKKNWCNYSNLLRANNNTHSISFGFRGEMRNTAISIHTHTHTHTLRTVSVTIYLNGGLFFYLIWPCMTYVHP